jgi:hypothetical protein
MSVILGISVRLTAELDGTWKEPFGLKKCEVRDLLLSIGYLNCAIKGTIKIGEMKAEVAVSYDNINPTRNMVYFDLESFQFSNILGTFDVHIPNEIANILNGISIRKMSNYMVPPPGMMLGSTFY